jgi:hypothetical protein
MRHIAIAVFIVGLFAAARARATDVPGVVNTPGANREVSSISPPPTVQNGGGAPSGPASTATATAAPSGRWATLRTVVGLLVLAVFGSVTVLAVVRFMVTMRYEAVEIQSHWGGFGGGIGGWRLSNPLAYLIVAVAFGGLLTTTAWILLRGGGGAAPVMQPVAAAGATAAPRK